MSLRSHLTDAIRRFWQDSRAAVAFETVIIIPILIWAFISSFIFFDAFRTYNSSIKATYAIADILSRQLNTVFAYDIEGMTTIFNHLVRNTGDVRLRVTQIRFDGTDYKVDWSHATGGEAQLFDSNMAALQDSLPVMAPAERIILVETFIPYRPAFDIGLDVFSFSNFTFTRPRYANQVPFDGSVTSPPTS
jgi:hypothetical protein